MMKLLEVGLEELEDCVVADEENSFEGSRQDSRGFIYPEDLLWIPSWR